MKSLFAAAALLTAASAMAQTETILFEGEKVIGNWDAAEQFQASDFTDAQGGDKIVVDVKDILTGENMWASCQLAKSDWSELTSYSLFDHSDQKQVTFTLTDEQASEIKANGVLVRGCFYTLLKVTYVNETVKDPEEPIDAKSIWTGSWETTSWGGMQDLAWGGYDWSSFTEGDKIIFTVEGLSNDAALKPADSSWTELSCGILPVKVVEQEVAITPSIADIAKLKENGLVVSGNNIRLTKVAVTTGGVSSAVHEIDIDTSTHGEPVIYDLQGRRLREAKGLVIINGKKVLID